MSQPTREEIICAHETLSYLCSSLEMGYRFGPATIKASENAIKKALLPKPPETMADVEWDDDVHYLAEAEHPNYGKVIMLWEASIGGITIIEGEIVATVDHDTLTPTGRRYTPTQPQEN